MRSTTVPSLVCARLDRATGLADATGINARKCFVFGADGAIQAIDATGTVRDLTTSATANSPVGPWSSDLGANQTDTVVGHDPLALWVADRAGSVVGASVYCNQALTGAGTVVVRMYKVAGSGGVPALLAGITLTLTVAGGERVASVNIASGTLTFVANDIVYMVYSSSAGITNVSAILSSSFAVRV